MVWKGVRKTVPDSHYNNDNNNNNNGDKPDTGSQQHERPEAHTTQSCPKVRACHTLLVSPSVRSNFLVPSLFHHYGIKDARATIYTYIHPRHSPTFHVLWLNGGLLQAHPACLQGKKSPICLNVTNYGRSGIDMSPTSCSSIASLSVCSACSSSWQTAKRGCLLGIEVRALLTGLNLDSTYKPRLM